MSNPYSSLPRSAFWRTAVAAPPASLYDELWRPKFTLTRQTRIATAGSCFAQHIGQRLRARGYAWLETEPPLPPLSTEARRDFQFGLFSFRTGNIYSAAMLRQWVAWATGNEAPSSECWERGGRFFDPVRPAIEPDGFASERELLDSRDATLIAIRRAISEAEVLFLTLGLTEVWRNAESGLVYCVCPGTVAGTFRPDRHAFANEGYAASRLALESAFEMCHRINPGLRFLLTVSPVPLTATAAPGTHVLAATTYSKSTLRAVAGDLAQREDTDYFPAYEIVATAPARGHWYEPNLRDVSAAGVDHVMAHFFAALGDREPVGPGEAPAGDEQPPREAEDEICEERILDRFNAA